MDPDYQLLVRYEPGTSPTAVVTAALTEWSASGRAPLRAFQKRTEVTPDASWVSDNFLFIHNRENVSATLRTSKRRTDVDVIRCMFTNPSVRPEFFPVNFLDAQFFHKRIEERASGYRPEQLASLLGSLCAAGPAVLAYIDLYEALHSPWMHEVSRRADAALQPGSAHGADWRQLHWLTWLPAVLNAKWIKQLEALGFSTLSTLSDGSAIVASSPDPPTDPQAHANHLKTAMEQLGWGA